MTTVITVVGVTNLIYTVLERDYGIPNPITGGGGSGISVTAGLNQAQVQAIVNTAIGNLPAGGVTQAQVDAAIAAAIAAAPAGISQAQVEALIEVAAAKPVSGPLLVTAGLTAGVQSDTAEVVAYHPQNKPVSLDLQAPGGQVTVNKQKVQTEADVIAKVNDLLTKSPTITSPNISNPRIGGTVFTPDGVRVLGFEHVNETTWLKISNGVAGPEIGVKPLTGSTIDGNIRLRPLGRGAVEVGTATSTATVRAVGDLTPDVDLVLEPQGDGKVKVKDSPVVTEKYLEENIGPGIQQAIQSSMKALPDKITLNVRSGNVADKVTIEAWQLTPHPPAEARSVDVDVTPYGDGNLTVRGQRVLTTDDVLAAGNVDAAAIQALVDAAVAALPDSPEFAAQVQALLADLMTEAGCDAACVQGLVSAALTPTALYNAVSDLFNVLFLGMEQTVIDDRITFVTNGILANGVEPWIQEIADAIADMVDADTAAVVAAMTKLRADVKALQDAASGDVGCMTTAEVDSVLAAAVQVDSLISTGITDLTNGYAATLLRLQAAETKNAAQDAEIATLKADVANLVKAIQAINSALPIGGVQAEITRLDTEVKAKADKTALDKYATTSNLNTALDSLKAELSKTDSDIVEWVIGEFVNNAALAQFGGDVEMAVGNAMNGLAAVNTDFQALLDAMNGPDADIPMIANMFSLLNNVIMALVDATGVPLPGGDAKLIEVASAVKAAQQAEMLNVLTGGKEVPANIDWTPCQRVAGTGVIEARLINGVVQFRGDLKYTQTASGSFTTVQKLPAGFPPPSVDTNLTTWAIETQVAYKVGMIRLNVNGDIGVSAPTGKFDAITFNGISYPVF